MCVNCMSNAEATLAAAIATGALVKAPAHRALARVGLAPDPDPVAHDVRTVAFLDALDLDPVDALGRGAVDRAAAWTPAPEWTPFWVRAGAAVDGAIARRRSLAVS